MPWLLLHKVGVTLRPREPKNIFFYFLQALEHPVSTWHPEMPEDCAAVRAEGLLLPAAWCCWPRGGCRSTCSGAGRAGSASRRPAWRGWRANCTAWSAGTETQPSPRDLSQTWGCTANASRNAAKTSSSSTEHKQVALEGTSAETPEQLQLFTTAQDMLPKHNRSIKSSQGYELLLSDPSSTQANVLIWVVQWELRKYNT